MNPLLRRQVRLTDKARHARPLLLADRAAHRGPTPRPPDRRGAGPARQHRHPRPRALRHRRVRRRLRPRAPPDPAGAPRERRPPRGPPGRHPLRTAPAGPGPPGRSRPLAGAGGPRAGHRGLDRDGPRGAEESALRPRREAESWCIPEQGAAVRGAEGAGARRARCRRARRRRRPARTRRPSHCRGPARADRAHEVRRPEADHPQAREMRLGCDDLDTPPIAAPGAAPPAEEAHRLARRPEVFPAPRTGSRLGMAAVAPSAPPRRRPDRRIGGPEELASGCAARERGRNAAGSRAIREFTMAGARVELRHLDPHV